MSIWDYVGLGGYVLACLLLAAFILAASKGRDRR